MDSRGWSPAAVPSTGQVEAELEGGRDASVLPTYSALAPYAQRLYT